MNQRQRSTRTFSYTTGQIIRAWSPFIILTIIIISWGMQPIKDVLNAKGLFQFEFPGLHNVILGSDGNPIPKLFKVNYLSAAGTAILLAALIAIPLVGLTYKIGVNRIRRDLKAVTIPDSFNRFGVGVRLHPQRFRHYPHAGRCTGEYGYSVSLFRACTGLAGCVHYRFRYLSQCAVQ